MFIGHAGQRELAAGRDRRGGFHHRDRNKLILAGIALSALRMGLTRITLLLAEDHALRHLY